MTSLTDGFLAFGLTCGVAMSAVGLAFWWAKRLRDAGLAFGLSASLLAVCLFDAAPVVRLATLALLLITGYVGLACCTGSGRPAQRSARLMALMAPLLIVAASGGAVLRRLNLRLDLDLVSTWLAAPAIGLYAGIALTLLLRANGRSATR